jgi:hypothetical protein
MKSYRKLVDDEVRKTVAAFRFKVSRHLVSAPGSEE